MAGKCIVNTLSTHYLPWTAKCNAVAYGAMPPSFPTRKISWRTHGETGNKCHPRSSYRCLVGSLVGSLPKSLVLRVFPLVHLPLAKVLHTSFAHSPVFGPRSKEHQPPLQHLTCGCQLRVRDSGHASPMLSGHHTWHGHKFLVDVARASRL